MHLFDLTFQLKTPFQWILDSSVRTCNFSGLIQVLKGFSKYFEPWRHNSKLYKYKVRNSANNNAPPHTHTHPHTVLTSSKLLIILVNPFLIL